MIGVRATRSANFSEEISPVIIPQRKEDPVIVDQDERPRRDTTLEKLASLRPAFKKDGTVTAGNASGINDGAAAVVIMSREKAAELGKRAIVSFEAFAKAGVHPSIMGYAPVPAVNKLLTKAGLRKEDIDLYELNEAFAAQAATCVRELGLDAEKVNVNGGAIALGHAVGCSGARLLVSLMNEMQRRRSRYGVISLCIGGGQGIATLVERCDED